MNGNPAHPRISPNSVAIAGEFAVLSQLALRGYDANMTLGRTKNVDVLVSDPRTNRMYQLEVKTNRDPRTRPANARLFGRFITSWRMHKKHESIARDRLWYCFVMVGIRTKVTRFFIVPSAVVAKYVRDEHSLWLKSLRMNCQKVSSWAAPEHWAGLGNAWFERRGTSGKDGRHINGVGVQTCPSGLRVSPGEAAVLRV